MLSISAVQLSEGMVVARGKGGKTAVHFRRKYMKEDSKPSEGTHIIMVEWLEILEWPVDLKLDNVL
jgi:hypothetical protein